MSVLWALMFFHIVHKRGRFRRTKAPAASSSEANQTMRRSPAATTA